MPPIDDEFDTSGEGYGVKPTETPSSKRAAKDLVKFGPKRERPLKLDAHRKEEIKEVLGLAAGFAGGLAEGAPDVIEASSGRSGCLGLVVFFWVLVTSAIAVAG